MRRPIYNGHDPGFMITMSEYTEGGHYVHRTDSPCKSTSQMRNLFTYFKLIREVFFTDTPTIYDLL